MISASGRSTKPVGGRIDWGHPLTQGLDICVLYQGGIPFDLVSGTRAATNAASIYHASPAGLARKVVTGKDDFGNLGDYSSIKIPGLTLHCLVTPTDTTSARICGRELATTNYGYYMAPSTTINRFIWNVGGGFITLSGSSLVIGKPIALTGVIGGTTKLYENGEQTASSASGYSAFPSTATTWNIGATVGTTTIYNGLISCVYQWKRPLTKDEARWIAREPYAFIRTGPKRHYTTTSATKNRMLMGVGN